MFAALLMVGCGDEGDVQEAGVEQDLGLDFKLPRTAPDGSSEIFKINKKEPNTLVCHEKWLVSTKAQYAPNPALYRKMWKDRKIQNVRDGYALKGLFERGATLEWVIYDRDGVHLFSFYLHKEDIQDSPPAEVPSGSPRASVRPEVGNPLGPIPKHRLEIGGSFELTPTGFSQTTYGRWDEEGPRKDGKRNGLWIFRYRPDKPKWEALFQDGKLLTVKGWKPNGEICPITKVADGNGVVVWYNKDGTEKIRLAYKDGWMDGLKNKAVGNYKDGQKDGLWIYYNEDGTEHYRDHYHNGELLDP